MPLFSRTDPDPHALIAYIVARARGRDVTLNRTKLVKLLYLIDVERVRSRRAPLTGFHWVFFHYGPYAFDLIDTLDAMEGEELTVDQWHDSVLYRAAPDASDASDWPVGTKSMVDHVVDEFGGLELNELLDFVYFHTGPMIDARRGQPLEMSRARDYTPPRRLPPLAPAPPPPDVADRLARWRRDHAQRLARARFEPPGRFLTDPDEGANANADTGRLHVPDDTQL